ncbi:MAG: DCC1-like thiol-disulfide oxidoreductase family protein [Planctomycetota bacterium]
MKPLLVYDGECRFCSRWVARLCHLTRGSLEAAPYQEVAPRFPSIPSEEFARAIKFVDADGTITSGVEAILMSLRRAGRWGWLHVIYKKLPGLSPLAEGLYRFAARHRPGRCSPR